MYKDIYKGYFSLLFTAVLSSFLHAGANQIWLTNGVWQPVGVQGIYKLDQSATSWEADFSNIIEDMADDNVTYAKGDEATANNYYVDKDNNTNNDFHTRTSKLHATIGLFAIKGGTSKKTSNYIDLDGSMKNNVKMKIMNIRNKDYNLPMYRMYIEGRPGVPAIRIDYQGDYEGDMFRIKFGEEEEDYFGYFRSTATWQQPEKLYVDVAHTLTSSSPIDRAVDFNLSDNSLLLLSENSFKILNDDGVTIGGDGITKFDSANSDFITMYTYSGYNKWSIFNSANINVGSNDFEEFSPGTGYWIRVDSKNAHSDNNATKIGIIAKDETEILDSAYDNVIDGWNMLSFPESDLRYASSGIFIPLDAIFTENGINIFFSQLGKNDANGDVSRENNITLEANATLSHVKFNEPADVAQYINLAVKNKKVLYTEETNLRAFPAMNVVDGNTQAGVILISDHTFEINSSNESITTLTGSPLKPTTHGTYSSIYGEYFLGVEMNNLSGTEINGSVDIFMPGANFNSAGAKAHDLNNSPSDIIKTADIINDALKQASIPLNGKTQGTPTKTFLIDFNFETNKPAHYHDPANFKSLLLSTQTRFSIRDITYMQTFKQDNNGSFYVAGKKSEIVTSGNGVTLKDAINSKKDVTDVVYTDLGNNYFAISSPSIRNLDLLESDTQFDSKLFDDVALNNGDIPKKHLTNGAITFVRDHRNIMSVDIITDLTILEGNKTKLPTTSLVEFNVSKTNNGGFEISGSFPFSSADLKPNAIWSTDFPQKDGPINIMARQGKDILEIMTMNKSTDNENYWAHTDLTKDPNDWYTSDQKDTQDIFHIFNQKAYWVKLKNKITTSQQSAYVTNGNSYINKSASSFTRRSYTHFNNHIIEGIGKTTNHLDHTLAVTLDPSFMDPSQNAYYDVLAVIAGEEHRLRHNGQGFIMRISSNELNIREKTDNVKYPILIKAYDGFGGVFEENATHHVWDMDYSKPKTPTLSWDETTGDLIIDNEPGTTVEIYQDYISDVGIERLKNKITNDKLYQNSKLAWKIPGNTDEGAMKVLKIVAKKNIKNNNFLYSDMRIFPYIPMKLKDNNESEETLHILAIDNNSTKNTVSNPYSFKQKQYLTHKAPSDSITPKYNGANGIDNGVEIARLKKAIDSDKSIKMIYAPIGNREGDKRLSAFGGNETMYLNIVSKFHTDSKPIAYITYIKEYAGNPFYISYGGSLYKGTFADSDAHNSDTNAYNLYSGSISAYFSTIGDQGNLIDYSNSTTNSQPIVIPLMVSETNTTDENNNTNNTNDTTPDLPNLP